MSTGKAPDPMATSQQQATFNTGAGTSQQELNMVNQTTPFGSLNYSQTGTNPDGTPIFNAAQTYAPAIQQNIDQLTTQMNATPTDVAKSQMDMYGKYFNPINQQAQTALDAKLASQGITPGSQAYNDAQNLQSRNVSDQQTNWMLNSGGLALQEQQQPYNLLNSLRTGAAPGFGTTPTATVQPPNYQQAVQSNYAQQVAQQNAMWQAAGSAVGAIGGGWARGGFAGA